MYVKIVWKMNKNTFLCASVQFSSVVIQWRDAQSQLRWPPLSDHPTRQRPRHSRLHVPSHWLLHCPQHRARERWGASQHQWCVSVDFCVSKCCLVPASYRVRRPVCLGSVIRRGAGCDWPPDTRVALSANSLPGSSPLLSHHLLLPHLQRPSQTLGEAGERWQSAAGQTTNTQGEEHAAICSLKFLIVAVSALY